MSRALIDLQGVSKTFVQGSQTVYALRDVDLTLGAGELHVVYGRSGSGKTTLLNVVGGLELPDEGSVHVAGVDMTALDDEGRVALRREKLAFVFQAFGLLPILSAEENVEVPLRLRRADPTERRARVDELLDLVGLSGRARHRPAELSGGEQQRVAIARALANRPNVLVADEPTGQLDSATGQRIMSLIERLVRETGLAVLLATHDVLNLSGAHRLTELRDGRLFARGGATSA